MAVSDIVPVSGARFEETLASASPDFLREMLTVGLTGWLTGWLTSEHLSAVAQAAQHKMQVNSQIFQQFDQPIGLPREFAVGLTAGLTAGLTGGLALGLAVGAAANAGSPWLRYLVATHILARRCELPQRPAPFLDWAYDAGLLRLAGNHLNSATANSRSTSLVP